MDRMRILIVDDHGLNRRMMARLLGALGHEATAYADGAEACAAPDLGQYDLALFDLHMPGMSGLDTATALRERLGAAAPPVFIVTADVTEETRRACLEAGVQRVYSKLITIDLLNALLDEAKRLI